MTQISRDPEDLVAQAIGANHQYPDGFMLFLGTMFAPVEDRGAPGMGFTHKHGRSRRHRRSAAGRAGEPRDDQRPGAAMDVRRRRTDAQPFGARPAARRMTTRKPR